jgi:MipA family protein
MPLFSRPFDARCLAGAGAVLAALCGPAAAAEPVDGAITLVATRAPEYLGARTNGHSFRPGFFLRWGRVTVSSSGGFAATRRQGEVRGLGFDITQTDEFDLSLGLRFDGGRDETDSPALRGMGDVPRTVRIRVGGEWRFAPQWKMNGNWTVDPFGRDGGHIADVSIRREWPLFDRRLEITTGGTITAGSGRYMQTYFGVTPEQSARSGYAVYSPDWGLRDAALFVSARAELSDKWVAIAGIGRTWLLGDAADSPIALRDSWWGMSVGVGYRF